MTDDEATEIRQIMKAASMNAAAGNGPCHEIYLALREVLERAGKGMAPPVKVNGFTIPKNIIDLINAEGELINAIREIRSLHGIPLKDAKDIVEIIRGRT